MTASSQKHSNQHVIAHTTETTLSFTFLKEKETRIRILNQFMVHEASKSEQDEREVYRFGD